MLLALFGAGLSAGLAPAQGPCLSGAHTQAQGGYPQAISCLARPSETKAYVGYYVGGGSPCRGHYRHPWEGTWGWDCRAACSRGA